MKVIILIFCSFLFASFSWAQASQSSKKDEARESPRSTGDVVPLPSIKTLTAAQALGKKLFVQRCSVCHLPALPSYTAYGPLLDGNTIESLGDATVREQIMHGSARMPGWQYTLSPAEIEQIIGYLKTLDFAKKG